MGNGLLLIGSLLAAVVGSAGADCLTRGTGDLGLIVERASGSVQIVDTTADRALARVEGLGDLSHASAVFSPDQRYAFVFGRDGGLSKVDLLCGVLVERIKQAGNSIGGAISQDGKLVAASNYEPGGVRLFAAADLTPVADIPALVEEGERSRVVGLVDAPAQRFVFSLFDGAEIWQVDVTDPQTPHITRHRNVGRQPYDGLITPDGRHYIAGLFGDEGLALLDLWHPEKGVRRILQDYGRGDRRLPVYKMPHLEGWAMAGDYVFLPAVGYHQLLVVARDRWEEETRIGLPGQPVFAVARPDARQVWVNFAFPNDDTVVVIDAATLEIVDELKPGKGVLHMEFTSRGEEVWISVRDRDEVHVYDAHLRRRKAVIPAKEPSGIFFSTRAQDIGL
jgi:protein NirF